MYVDVVLPGIWWHPLTYAVSEPVEAGCRVVVPMGPRHGKRVGFVLATKEKIEDGADYEIKEIIKVLDQTSVLSWELWSLSEWVSRQYLCSQGEILKLMCPSSITKGCEVTDINPSPQKPAHSFYSEECIYEIDDEERYKRYIDTIENVGSGLILFPEEAVAKSFWDRLPKEIQERALLWPSGGGKKTFDAWLRARRKEVSLVIGSVGVLFAPLAPIELVLIEEEASYSYTFVRYPYLSLRHIAAKRAQMWGSRLIFGGRIPSSRLYLLKRPQLKRNVRDQIQFANIRTSTKPILPRIIPELPISSILLKNSLEVINRGEVVIWILDRKGYAGEISCEECGWTMTCPECGSFCRISQGETMCFFCGRKSEIPTVCPSCMSRLLVGRRPGIEALYEIARALVGDAAPTCKWYKEKSGKKLRASMLKELEHGGIIVGSRLSLSFCDDCPVGLVGWIDADAEARRPQYDARFAAFSMIWESRFRGKNTDKRKVIVQSRRPYRGWQKGLRLGWQLFWDEELKERYELNFPPFNLLIEMTGPSKVIEEVFSLLDKSGFAVYKPIADEAQLWIKTKEIKVLRELLEPYFHISRSKIGFPKARIWRD